MVSLICLTLLFVVLIILEVQLPRFDSACYVDSSGLADGFVVGLHNLQHFMASVVQARGLLLSKTEGESSTTGT